MTHQVGLWSLSDVRSGWDMDCTGTAFLNKSPRQQELQKLILKLKTTQQNIINIVLSLKSFKNTLILCSSQAVLHSKISGILTLSH